jgi:2-polyprenyl-3-methyl-5-hydroxy-6-metoxy-1,4-benzoquinol methylase
VKANLFKRADATYDLSQKSLDAIIADEANPITRIANLLPSRSTVLDVGAGNGVLADVVRMLQNAVVLDGVEPSRAASQIACRKYRSFHCGFHESHPDNMATSRKYDAIVAADVIEHTPDPQEFLQSLQPCLAKGGKIYLSVPNVSFGSLRVALLCGKWDYTDWGLVERTHLRYFTKRTILELAEAIGMHIERIDYLRRSPFDMDIQIQNFRLNPFTLRSIYRDPLASVYQFVVVLTFDAVQELRETWYGGLQKSILVSYFRRRWQL